MMHFDCVEPRFRKLCSQILEIDGQCSDAATLSASNTLN